MPIIIPMYLRAGITSKKKRLNAKPDFEKRSKAELMRYRIGKIYFPEWHASIFSSNVLQAARTFSKYREMLPGFSKLEGSCKRIFMQCP